MTPEDPNEPLPTTPVSPPASAPPSTPQWGAPPPAWGPPPWAQAPVPPPPPPPRDRVALAVVGVVFGGLFLVFFAFLLLAYGAATRKTS
jgi:protease-4